MKTVMVISFTMDIEINTTANYTLEEIVLVHMFWANVIFKQEKPTPIQWHSSEKKETHLK